MLGAVTSRARGLHREGLGAVRSRGPNEEDLEVVAFMLSPD